MYQKPKWQQPTREELLGRRIACGAIVLAGTILGAVLAGFGLYMFGGRVPGAIRIMVNDTTHALFVRLFIGAILGAAIGLYYGLKLMRRGGD